MVALRNSKSQASNRNRFQIADFKVPNPQEIPSTSFATPDALAAHVREHARSRSLAHWELCVRMCLVLVLGVVSNTDKPVTVGDHCISVPCCQRAGLRAADRHQNERLRTIAPMGHHAISGESQTAGSTGKGRGGAQHYPRESASHISFANEQPRRTAEPRN